MARLPLIFEILEELRDGVASVADVELREGAMKGVDSIIEALTEIQPAYPDLKPPSEAEKFAQTWLMGNQPKTFLPEEIVSRLTDQLERALPQPKSTFTEKS